MKHHPVFPGQVIEERAEMSIWWCEGAICASPVEYGGLGERMGRFVSIAHVFYSRAAYLDPRPRVLSTYSLN
jgi:hypothetical protein